MKRFSLLLLISVLSLTASTVFSQCDLPSLRLGNQVWNDFDGDGKRDSNEPGIGNVTVSLYTDNDGDNLPDGAAVATTVTDVFGRYLITGLTPGRYIASIPLLPGYAQSPNTTTQATSPFPDTDVDNDNNIVHNRGGILYTNAITLTAGGEPVNDGDDADGNLTFDLAECGNAFIGDFVWNDLNGNGIQDAGEPGINGVTVTLTFPDGTTTSTVTAFYNNHNGYYDFKNLGPATYKVTFTTPAGFTPTVSNAGANDSLDSDPVNNEVFVVIASNQSDFTVDAGYVAGTPGNLRLGNQVWNDFDGDGKRDSNEPGIGNVTVTLYRDDDGDNLPDGPEIATTVTDVYGRYLFTELTPGRYIASIPLLPGYSQSPNTTTQATSPFPDTDVDNDNNIVHNRGGILYTNAITLTAGGEPTFDGDDANGNLTFDLAECGNAFIGDFVWNDVNQNGLQDTGEPGINGATVTLTYPDGTMNSTVTAFYNNHDGYYDFKNLGPGNYKVTFTTPAGFTPTIPNVGTNDSLDSDPINGNSVPVTIAANQSDFTIDAGYFLCPPKNLRLGNQVWNDFDGDGKRDSNEPGIGNVTVSLYTDNDGDNLPDGPAIKTTVTDLYGHYLFTGLAPGRYIASIPLLPGYAQSPNSTTQATSPFPDNDVDNDNNIVHNRNGVLFTNAITLTEGGEPTYDGDDADGNLTFDLAECGNSFIGDFVWNDLNANGLQDAGEPGINGVTVILTFPDGTTTSTVTAFYNNHDGYYDFKNLGPDTYKVTFITPAGFTPTITNVGTNDSLDSDPVNGDVYVTLGPNQSDFTIDAGYINGSGLGLHLGNFVWNDINSDGIKDVNEPGVPGATVNLYRDNDGDNTPDSAAIATTTTVNGYYLFSNLSDGKYIVGVVVPAEYGTGATTPTSDASDNDVDNDNNGVNYASGEVRTNYITLAAGTEPTNDGDDSNGNLTLDVALKGNASIGDFVWNDVNRNGIQDVNETGVANAHVRLIFPDGTVRDTTTNALGIYHFTALGPGTYTVQFTTPAGMTPSPANVGTNDAKDSDPLNGDVQVTLAANQTNNTIDAGFYITPCIGPGCISNLDDIDDDNDGILDVVEGHGYDALADCDGDGIPNYLDSTPGCTTPVGVDYNGHPFQPLTWSDCNSDGINDFFDWDKDGIIDELDLDSDNDGILDVQEARDPRAVDNNHDGMVDGVDNDNDGLLSTADMNDNDPSIAASVGLIPQDLDRDGLPNYIDLDSDGDGLSDNREALELDAAGPNYNGLTMGTNDDDRDGVRTVNYTVNDNDADNIRGFGAKGIILRDNDNDGYPNPYDIDSDNDGITDNVEGQPTCSEIQPSGNDADGDGLDDVYDIDNNPCIRKAPGITPYDKDQDGTPDIRDLDTDNDGAPDVNEGAGISGNFVTNYNDTDGDGLIDQFDVFNILTEDDTLQNNVVHSGMGPNGVFDGPMPEGSSAPLPGEACPSDRDWRNVSILPVMLVQFNGALNNNIVKLNWKVVNEVNMSHYIVERSTNGIEFRQVGRVLATGNNTATTNYTFTDEVSGLHNVVAYYRLRQVEKSGLSKMSNVLAFKLGGNAAITMSLYPNPANSYCIVRVNAVNDGMATVRIVDAAGKSIITKAVKLSAGTNAITVDEIKNLAGGIYNVQVMLDGQMLNQKLVVVK